MKIVAEFVVKHKVHSLGILAAVLQKEQYSMKMDSLVNFIVAPDVKEDDLSFRDYDGHGDPIAGGNAYCLDAGLLAAEMMVVPY